MPRCKYVHVPGSWDALPHRCVFYRRDSLDEPLTWAIDQFGEQNPPYTFHLPSAIALGRWAFTADVFFCFRDIDDAMAFKLRWG